MSLIDKLSPFSAIARELTILRELYELDLASRNPPILRVTQSPSRDDTEVTYADEVQKPKSAMQKMLDRWNEDDEQD